MTSEWGYVPDDPNKFADCTIDQILILLANKTQLTRRRTMSPAEARSHAKKPIRIPEGGSLVAEIRAKKARGEM